MANHEILYLELVLPMQREIRAAPLVAARAARWRWTDRA
jgi:hypothetical protein